MKKTRNSFYKILISLAFLCLLSGGLLQATVYNMPEKALKSQFPGAEIKRKSLFLRKSDRERLEKELGEKLKSRLHTFYVASQKGKVLGYATFDTHRVRSKEETLFVALDKSGRVRHVEVISFFEPQEYLAPARWLRLLVGKSDGIRAGVDLPSISGATMTTNAVTRSVRKVVKLQKFHFGP